MSDTSIATTTGIDPAALMEQVVIQGDLSKLSTADRWAYYQRVCQSLGLNPLTKPFEYISLGGKLTLYARRDCTDQLRALRKISVAIVSREKLDTVYVVTARATGPDGRSDESIGAVALATEAGGTWKPLQGEALANAMMRAETKSKRRVTLSLSGLGWLDETEVETIPDARVVAVPVSDEATVPVATATEVMDAAEALRDAYYQVEKALEARGKTVTPEFKSWFGSTYKVPYVEASVDLLIKCATDVVGGGKKKTAGGAA